MTDLTWWLLLTPPDTLWLLILGWHAALAAGVAAWAYRRGRARERRRRRWPYF